MQEEVQGRRTPLQVSRPVTPCPSSSPLPRPPSPPRPPSSPPRPTSPDPPLDSDQGDGPDEDDYPPATNPKIRTALKFIRMVKESTLASQFDPEELAELLDPQEHASTPSDDPTLKLSLMNFISFMGSSQATYEAARQNVHECYPDINILSHYQAERRAQNLSGVITWEHHMCVKSCLGFTGPFASLERCPKCGESRYREKDLVESDGERKVPRQVFTTFPVGP